MVYDTTMAYFLYARKSTDVEDKQVLSIEAQLAELRALAKQEGLHIIEEFIEKRSAKKPGRPIFNDVMNRIQRGEAQGIICWKLDRLARNPVDDGLIRWLLQQATIQRIATPEKSYYPPDNVLLMSVEFAAANQFIRDLSSNTARGLRQKARRGEYPGLAPIGYLNNPRDKSIAVDRRKSKLVRRAFEMYATGNNRLEDIADFFKKHDVISRNENRVHISRVSYILSNPFYCGLFRYCGELHEGKHEPIITKRLFDEVQKVLHGRGRTPEIESDPRPYCGLIRCGSCEMMITGENKVKRQVSGKVHHYVYYHCSKKSKTTKCSEPAVRGEVLDRQLSALLAKYVMPKDWAEELSRMTDKKAQNAVYVASASVEVMREDVKDISRQLDRLLDLHVAQDIERDDYLERRRTLVLEKKSVEEQIALLQRNASAWVEPMREWITEASTLDEIAKNFDLPSKKSSLQKIFGSNLSLHTREARGVGEKQWFSLAQAKEKIGKFETTLILEGSVR
jgi:site-specific DNA recombinase